MKDLFNIEKNYCYGILNKSNKIYKINRMEGTLWKKEKVFL